jgi:hypothetical protein
MDLIGHPPLAVPSSTDIVLAGRRFACRHGGRGVFEAPARGRSAVRPETADELACHIHTGLGYRLLPLITCWRRRIWNIMAAIIGNSYLRE